MEIYSQFPWYSPFACYSSITYYLNLLYNKFGHLRYLSSTSGGSNSKGEDNTEPNSNEGNAKSSKGKKGQGRIAVTYKRKAPNKRKEIRLSFLHVVNAFAD